MVDLVVVDPCVAAGFVGGAEATELDDEFTVR
jgi:hypothetical protein